MRHIIPGAGPFHFEGTEIGILMIPGGGGGTCADLKPLAEDLYTKSNYTIDIALLPGFGTSPDDLRKSTIKMWKDALNEELSLLKTKCQKIIIGGHSMGGILSLIIAEQYDIDGIFLIGTPRGIRSIGAKLIPLISIFMKYHKIPSEEFKKQTNGKWVGYDKIPLNVVKKYKKLIKNMRLVLPNIKSPIIIFQGRLDTQIKKDSLDYIYDNIGSKIKKKVWLEHNKHPILDSPDHNEIIQELDLFILNITK